jgi:hypothetical protein
VGYTARKWLDCGQCGIKHLTAEIGRMTEPKAYDHHVEQVRLYRLLLHMNGIDVETAEIIYMDMERQLRLPVDLLSLDDARSLLETRLAPFLLAEMPPILEGEGAWQCDYCPVRAACERLHGGPVGKDREIIEGGGEAN